MKLMRALLGVGLMVIATSVVAKDIKLYQSPTLKSPEVAHAVNTADLTPFYYSQTYPNWVKVADRRTGQTGWANVKIVRETVQRHAAQNAHRAGVVRVYENGKLVKQVPAGQPLNIHENVRGPHHENIVIHGKPGQSEHIVIHGHPNDGTATEVIDYSSSKLTPQQMHDLLKNMQRREMRLQEDMLRMQRDMNAQLDMAAIGPQPEHVVVHVPAPASTRSQATMPQQLPAWEQKLQGEFK